MRIPGVTGELVKGVHGLARRSPAWSPSSAGPAPTGWSSYPGSGTTPRGGTARVPARGPALVGRHARGSATSAGDAPTDDLRAPPAPPTLRRGPHARRRPAPPRPARRRRSSSPGAPSAGDLPDREPDVVRGPAGRAVDLAQAEPQLAPGRGSTTSATPADPQPTDRGRQRATVAGSTRRRRVPRPRAGWALRGLRPGGTVARALRDAGLEAGRTPAWPTPVASGPARAVGGDGLRRRGARHGRRPQGEPARCLGGPLGDLLAHGRLRALADGPRPCPGPAGAGAVAAEQRPERGLRARPPQSPGPPPRGCGVRRRGRRACAAPHPARARRPGRTRRSRPGRQPRRRPPGPPSRSATLARRTAAGGRRPTSWSATTCSPPGRLRPRRSARCARSGCPRWRWPPWPRPRRRGGPRAGDATSPSGFGGRFRDHRPRASVGPWSPPGSVVAPSSAPASGAAGRQADASRRRNGPRKACCPVAGLEPVTGGAPITVRLSRKSCLAASVRHGDLREKGSSGIQAASPSAGGCGDEDQVGRAGSSQHNSRTIGPTTAQQGIPWTWWSPDGTGAVGTLPRPCRRQARQAREARPPHHARPGGGRERTNPRQPDRAVRVELTAYSKGPVIRAEAAAVDKMGALDWPGQDGRPDAPRQRPSRQDPPQPHGDRRAPDVTEPEGVDLEAVDTERQLGSGPVDRRRPDGGPREDPRRAPDDPRPGALQDGAGRPRLLPVRRGGDRPARRWSTAGAGTTTA